MDYRVLSNKSESHLGCNDSASEQLLRERRDLVKALGESMLRIKELEEKVYTDSLTGIGNRHLFEDELPGLVDAAHENNEPLALAIFDVNGLKRANDRYNHLTGDGVLKKVSSALQLVARNTDLVGRHGGDEFYALLPGFVPLDGQSEDELISMTSQRYQEAVDNSIAELGLAEDLHLGVSFGLAILEASESSDELYLRADEAARANKLEMYTELSAQNIVLPKDTRILDEWY